MSNHELLTPTPINKTQIGPVLVSTVICYSGFSESRMAETMVFLDSGATLEGVIDQDGERCHPSAADSMHDRWCRKVSEAHAKAARETNK